MISQILFSLVLAAAIWYFAKNVGIIRRNILLGRDVDLSDNKPQRWRNMIRVALGQSKMVVRPIAGFLHIVVYAGFVLINIEVLEIVIDGVAGTHRVFAPLLGGFYDFLIGFFEWLALGVLVACVIFLIRRYGMRIQRFHAPEMKDFPQRDAATILVVEIVLMMALLTMNAADQVLQSMGNAHYTAAGSFPVSTWLVPMFSGLSEGTLIFIERAAWWGHIIGILIFLNYLPFSKHFHIILAFPNTYYGSLKPKGELDNMASVTQEVKLMMDPSAPMPEGDAPPPSSFGAKDVTDLSWKNLMDAYTCTECGRCTSSCPANMTGKKLSPRKVMMDTRDRLVEVGTNIDKHGKDHDDGKTLHNYISEEELWACTTCNACAEACPVNINPVDIIVQMRQYKVMEQSSAPSELTNMFNNLENNQAPWQFSPADRFNWSQEINQTLTNNH